MRRETIVYCLVNKGQASVKSNYVSIKRSFCPCCLQNLILAGCLAVRKMMSAARMAYHISIEGWVWRLQLRTCNSWICSFQLKKSNCYTLPTIVFLTVWWWMIRKRVPIISKDNWCRYTYSIITFIWLVH
jgi:hypothetical protein